MLRLKHGDPWVYGALLNIVWSMSNSMQGGSYSNFLIRPFVNDNFPDGVYVSILAVERTATRWRNRADSKFNNGKPS